MHIVSEMIVLTSLVVWISSYRKKTTVQIEKLLLRIEEQDEKIAKLEQSLQGMKQLLETTARVPRVEDFVYPMVPPTMMTPTFQKTPVPVAARSSVPKRPPPAAPVVSPPPAPARMESVESEQELDDLLRDELAELVLPLRTDHLPTIHEEKQFLDPMIAPSGVDGVDGVDNVEDVEELSTADAAVKKKVTT